MPRPNLRWGRFGGSKRQRFVFEISAGRGVMWHEQFRALFRRYCISGDLFGLNQARADQPLLELSCVQIQISCVPHPHLLISESKKPATYRPGVARAGRVPGGFSTNMTATLPLK